MNNLENKKELYVILYKKSGIVLNVKDFIHNFSLNFFFDLNSAKYILNKLPKEIKAKVSLIKIKEFEEVK